MRARRIKASAFKAECLALMDEVAETGRPIVVTKHGRPVVQVLPVEEPPSLVGSVTYCVADEALLFSTGERWSADDE